MPRPRDLQFVLDRGDPEPSTGIRHVVTTLDGEFAIPGFSRGRKNMLVAGAPGLLTTAYALVREPGEKELQLVATPAYGAVLHLVDEHGVPLVTPNLFRSSAGLRWSCNDPEMEPTGFRAFAAVLCGVSPAVLEKTVSSKVLLYSYEQRLPQIGPCWVHIKCPGFLEKQALFSPALLDEFILEQDVFLAEVPTGLSTLEFQVIGVQHDRRPTSGLFPLKLVLNDHATGRRDIVGVDVDLAGGTFLVEGVPAGILDYRIESFDGFWRRPREGPAEVALERGVSQTIRVDLSDAGAIQVVPLLPNGELYDGYLTMLGAPGKPTVEIDGRRTMRHLATFSQECPPYVFPLVDSGEYTLRGVRPPWSAPAEDGYCSFRVSSGSVARLEVLAGP